MCTINDNHMMYGSWDMEYDGQNLLSFWTICCLFTPLTTWKIKISKKWKKHLEILSFYTCVPKIMIRWCIVPEIWCVADGQKGGQTDGWTDGLADGRRKWRLEVGAPPKKRLNICTETIQNSKHTKSVPESTFEFS